jgi:predicted MFS family arabinose efflux permease
VVAGSQRLLYLVQHLVGVHRLLRTNADALRGLLAAFGVYQEYYESIALSSPSNISWIGSLQGAVLLFPCLIVGYLYDLGYLRTLLWVGHGFLVLGMLLTSFGSQYWHFVLTQGVMVGFGASCLFLPSVSIIQQYFTSRKSLATGLAGAGNAIGTSVDARLLYS